MNVFQLLGWAQKLGGLFNSATESDEALKAIEPGDFTVIDLPKEAHVKFDSRGGKRFSVCAVRVKRLK